VKILFLDCDGVLNSAVTMERVGRYLGLEAALVQRAQAMVAASGATVVLSSTWRLYPEMLAEVKRHFTVHDVTPDLGTSRGAEIAAWLEAHPEVERYVIVDDDRDMTPEQLPHCFFTDWYSGLTQKVADAVVAHLTA